MLSQRLPADAMCSQNMTEYDYIIRVWMEHYTQVLDDMDSSLVSRIFGMCVCVDSFFAFFAGVCGRFAKSRDIIKQGDPFVPAGMAGLSSH
jgi:hypothetical protein